MTLLLKLVLKIKNTIISLIGGILLSIIMLFCVIGFFVLPFIVYIEAVRDSFLIIWGICAIEFFIEMIIVTKNDAKTQKKEMKEYRKDKVVYWFLRVSALFVFVVVLLLVFLKRNYSFPITVYEIITGFIALLIVSALISSLLSMYKNRYKQLMQDCAIILLSLLCLLSITAGIILYQEFTHQAKILIAFSATVLLILGIRYAFKLLLSIKTLNTVLLSIILFIAIGICGGIILRYVITDSALQEVLTTIFASVLGGVITLGGVALTIRHTQNERKEEEKKKAKPIFTFNMVYESLFNVKDKKVCFEDYGKVVTDLARVFPCNVVAQIENSNHAVFSIEKIYHDNQWWSVKGNNVVLPNKTVYLDFNFNEDVNNLFMEIKDGLDNHYYYEIKVLYIGFIDQTQVGTAEQPKRHTIRELKEITIEEINESIEDVEA